MGIFGNILGKLGISKEEAATTEETSAPEEAAAKATPTTTPASAPSSSAPSAAPAAGSVVDVEAQLEALAAANSQSLNWKQSIVDLLKLLEIDSSYGARKELATELGCPAELMGDSAQMNVWLHKTVLRKIAENGGKVPAELLD